MILSADWHLDCPWGELPADLAAGMRRSAREMPYRIARIAREEQADMILLPGDLFDSANVYAESKKAVEEAFRGLDIPVFIAPGNHDPYVPGSVWDRLDLPENVHVFRSRALERVELPGAYVYGCAYGDSLPADFWAEDEEDKPHILLLHADLGGSYMPITETDLAASGFSLAALGHIHKPSGLNMAGDVAWCYPGCPMGRGFDELGPRGAMLLTLENGRWQGEFLELCDRRYEVIEVPVTGKDAHAALALAVRTARPGDICRFELTGFCENAPTQTMLDAMASARGLHFAVLKNKTALPPDSGAGTIRGTLLRIAGELPAAPEQMSRALKWALAALDGAEAPEEVAK